MTNLIRYAVGFLSVFLSFQSAQAILGGTKVTGDEYKKAPVVALLHGGSDLDAGLPCTAIALNQRTILTAAHCVKDGSIKVYRTNNIDSATKNSSSGISVRDNQIIKHPQYNPAGHVNDFAIIKLRSNLYRNNEVEFPELSLESNFATYTIYGYGEDLRHRQGQLNKVIKTKEELILGRIGRENNLEFDQSKGTGICSGDSGGPMFALLDNRLQLVALNTAVTPTKDKDQAFCTNTGVGTKVSSVIDWIKANL